MKKIFYFLLSISFLVSCTMKDSSERDDAKYLGTWKSNPKTLNGKIIDGSYNYVKIELSGDDEFPYRLTPCQFSGSSQKHYEFNNKRYKIRDNRLIGETIEGGYEFSFQIREKDNEFRYTGDNQTSGPLKNHTK